MAVYAEPAGGRQAAPGSPDSGPSGSPPPPVLWKVPGHPGTCPKCSSPHVQFTWKPDLNPTSERARCHHCGWTETRAPVPRGLQVGDRVVVHLASCESPEQHERVTLAGRIIEVYPDGAAVAVFPGGSRMELCPWFDSGCANARPAAQERAA